MQHVTWQTHNPRKKKFAQPTECGVDLADRPTGTSRFQTTVAFPFHRK